MNNKVNIYTDLAIESAKMAKKEKDSKIKGIKVNIEEKNSGEIRVTWVEILDEIGSKQLGKPIGNYVTIESSELKENSPEIHEEVAKELSQNLAKLHNLKNDSVVLVIGLGNISVTPDALGPEVISKVLVTRHITNSGAIPENIEMNVRPVCAIAPGVLGVTGIETAETIKGIADRVKPDLIIAIDALAARETNRINTTIQLSDTGVSPGAGLGNKRTSINKETMGVPVIAIGVPTVVDAATLVNDALDKMLEAMIAVTDEGSEFYEMLADLEVDEKYEMIAGVLNPYMGNMFVTPKEVNAVINRLSTVIANAINIALHPSIGTSDLYRYLR